MAFNFEGAIEEMLAEIARVQKEINADPQNFWKGGGGPRLYMMTVGLRNLADQLRKHYRVVNGR